MGIFLSIIGFILIYNISAMAKSAISQILLLRGMYSFFGVVKK